jgi:hypothetical protein
MNRKIFGVRVKINVREDYGAAFKRLALFEAEYFGLVMHFFDSVDGTAPPHDHGSKFVTFALKGGYEEELWDDPVGRFNSRKFFSRRQWSAHYMSKAWAHRVTKLLPNREGKVTTVVFWFGKREYLPNYYTAEGKMDFFQYWDVSGFRELLRMDASKLSPREKVLVP